MIKSENFPDAVIEEKLSHNLQNINFQGAQFDRAFPDETIKALDCENYRKLWTLDAGSRIST